MNYFLGKKDFYSKSWCFEKCDWSAVFNNGPGRMTVSYWEYYLENKFNPPTNDFFVERRLAQWGYCRYENNE